MVATRGGRLRAAFSRRVLTAKKRLNRDAERMMNGVYLQASIFGIFGGKPVCVCLIGIVSIPPSMRSNVSCVFRGRPCSRINVERVAVVPRLTRFNDLF